MPLPSLQSLVNDHVLLFPETHPSTSRSSPASQTLGFRTRPKIERHVRYNAVLWRSVQQGVISTEDLATLRDGSSLVALALPRALHDWLAGLAWPDVSHAVLCILHDATCSAPEWRVPASYPARLAPSVAHSLASLQPHPTHCPHKEIVARSSRRGRRLPLVTPASRALDDLLQDLAGDRLWTVPVYVVTQGDDPEIVNKIKDLMPQWSRYRSLAVRKDVDRLSDVSKRFMDIVRAGSLREFWREVDTVFDMGGVGKRRSSSKTRDQAANFSRRIGRSGAQESSSKHGSSKRVRKGNTFFSYLPEEVVTEHIVPSLCIRKKGSVLASPADEEV